MKKILFITQVYPSGLTGTTVKTRQTIQFLLDRGFKIDVTCVHHEQMIKNEFEHPNLRIFTVVKNQIISRVTPSYIVRAFSLIFSLEPFRVRKMFDHRLRTLIDILEKQEKYDFILYDGFSTLQYARNFQSNYIYVDDEDITDLVIKRARSSKNPLIKLFFWTEYYKCTRYEARQLQKVAQIWAISPNTAKRLKKLSPAKTVVMPTIVEKKKNAFNSNAQHLVFTGLLSWLENVNGLKWFIDTCWPEILEKYPKLKFYVIGQLADKELQIYLKNAPNVVYKGYVEDLKTVYQQCSLAIAPIFINSGIKVKVLTFLSYGLPTVAFPVTTWGMTSTDGIIVSKPTAFIRDIIAALPDKKRRKKLSLAGHRNIEKNHSYATLERFFKQNGVL